MAQLFFCSDFARRDSSGEWIVRVEGWCLCTAAIEALFVETATELQRVPFGFARPDLRVAYPDTHSPERGGFRVTTKVRAGAPVKLVVQTAGQAHEVFVEVETRSIQTFQLSENTRTALALPANEIEEQLAASLARKPGITLRLDIINKCNLRCVMCHFSDDAVFKRPARQLTTDEFKRLFEEIGPHVRDVALSCGDEPLVAKHLPEILRYLAGEHPHVAVEFCTNATLLRGPIRDVIMETGVARLLFSVDAVSKGLFEKIRVGARYEQVIGNILALRDLRERLRAERPVFQFNYVLMVRNVHEAPAFVRMAKLMGGEAIDFRHVVPIPPYFEPEQLLELEPARFNYYRTQIVAAAGEHGIHADVPAPFATTEEWRMSADALPSLDDFFAVVAETATTTGTELRWPAVQRAEGWEGSASEQFATTFCNRPFSEVMVRDQDEVLPCPWHAKPLGRLSDGRTLSEIFFGKEFAALRRNMLNAAGDPGCARCPIKSGHLPAG